MKPIRFPDPVLHRPRPGGELFLFHRFQDAAHRSATGKQAAEHISTLASDAYEGRETGSAGKSKRAITS